MGDASSYICGCLRLDVWGFAADKPKAILFSMSMPVVQQATPKMNG